MVMSGSLLLVQGKYTWYQLAEIGKNSRQLFSLVGGTN